MKISVGISTNSEAEVSVDLRGFCKKIEAKHILHIAIIFLIEKKSSALTGLLKVAAIFI